MSIAINEIIEDLMIIGTTEPDVLVEIEPTEFYSEDYIEELVSKLEEILEAIDYLQK